MTRIVEGLNVASSKLQKPFRLIVGGPSGSGKSFFVKNLVENNHFESDFNTIHYIYPEYLDECPISDFETETPLECTAGLPSCKDLSLIENNSLIILDDLMLEVSNCDNIARLFTVIARKKNISVILIVQNVYQQGKNFRNIRLSATGLVLFKFYAGIDTNKRILRDVGMSSLIPNSIMEEVFSYKFNYIFVDLHPNRHSDFSALRSNIFENYFNLYYKMEYVAIPKADFVKFFKIIEAKKGKVKAIKNAVKIRSEKCKRKRKSDGKEEKTESDSKRRREETRESSESEYSESSDTDSASE